MFLAKILIWFDYEITYIIKQYRGYPFCIPYTHKL
nr:MAG TPA: hypothetical protein [Caudoviricetes sp.]DAS00066.1 MAG TPA: hypothetical protein [Caudoviricetes sp.]